MSWRDRVKQIARERATAESLELWDQPSTEEPRFNYRWEHLLAVERLCGWLSRELGGDEEVVTAAVWLHDLVKSHGADLPEVSDSQSAAAEARLILEGTDFPGKKIDAVCQAILTHEGLFKDHPLAQLEGAILWDADKLSKLGATHIVHNLCIRPVFDPRFQGRPTGTELVLRSEGEWLEMGERIVASMNTALARQEASRRLNYLKGFVEELGEEWKKS